MLHLIVRYILRFNIIVDVCMSTLVCGFLFVSAAHTINEICPPHVSNVKLLLVTVEVLLSSRASWQPVAHKETATHLVVSSQHRTSRISCLGDDTEASRHWEAVGGATHFS